jgi:hypothetical protein
MSQKNRVGTVASLAVAAALALPMSASTALAKDEAILRLRAFAIDMNNSRTGSIDIVIERWSTEEEVQKLRGVLIEKGGDNLLPTLQKIKPRCGYTRTSTSLGWDLQFARETVMSDGTRKIVVGTDRPMSMWELRQAGRSTDYEFSLAEIRLPADGKGQGKAIPRAKLSFNKEKNPLEIENYEQQPVRLNEITVVK